VNSKKGRELLNRTIQIKSNAIETADSLLQWVTSLTRDENAFPTLSMDWITDEELTQAAHRTVCDLIMRAEVFGLYWNDLSRVLHSSGSIQEFTTSILTSIVLLLSETYLKRSELSFKNPAHPDRSHILTEEDEMIPIDDKRNTKLLL
jgi:hypothetical protein